MHKTWLNVSVALSLLVAVFRFVGMGPAIDPYGVPADAGPAVDPIGIAPELGPAVDPVGLAAEAGPTLDPGGFLLD